MIALVPLDLEALLVALVLDPATYSRNRFFHLYTDPAARRVRRRAVLVRSIIRHVAAEDAARRGEIVDAVPLGDGWVELSYTVPALGLRRITRLDAMELCLVRFAIVRAPGARRSNVDEDADRQRIEGALRRLAQPVAIAEPGTGTSA